MKNSHVQLLFAVLISFATLLEIPVAAAPSFSATGHIAVQSSKPLPSQVTTTDGRIYRAVKLLQVLPDGLLVQYLPDSGGMGLARLKFTKLPESFRKQFGYDLKKASDYEKAEKIVMTELSRRLREDEDIQTATLTGTARSSVIVEASRPLVSYEYYDPAGPKPAQISEDMSGDTAYYFNCNPIFTFRVTHQGAGEPFNFHIETVTMQLGVTITINLPKGENGKLKDHEEGHKKIVEYFYSLGPAVAQQAGGLVTGLEQTSSAAEYDTARTEVFTKATEEVQTEYLKYIRDLCQQANDYYDELTDHGRNSMDSNQAADKAIHRYAPQVTN
jgi:hypothetical protein